MDEGESPVSVNEEVIIKGIWKWDDYVGFEEELDG